MPAVTQSPLEIEKQQPIRKPEGEGWAQYGASVVFAPGREADAMFTLYKAQHELFSDLHARNIIVDRGSVVYSAIPVGPPTKGFQLGQPGVFGFKLFAQRRP